MNPTLKKTLIGLYLCGALVYFAFNDHRITATPKHKTHYELQALNLALESVLFPFFVAYHQLYLDGPPPVQPRL